MGARKEAHLVQVLGQGSDRVRVVRDIEHQCWLTRYDLEAPRQLDHCQPDSDCLRADWQTLIKQFKGGQHTGCIEQLVDPAQRRISHAAEAARPS